MFAFGKSSNCKLLLIGLGMKLTKLNISNSIGMSNFLFSIELYIISHRRLNAVKKGYCEIMEKAFGE
jgi:hypothetical protein